MKTKIALLLALAPAAAFAQSNLVPVYESFNRSSNDQLITLSYGEGASVNYNVLNGVNFYVSSYQTSADQYLLYRCNVNGSHMVSPDASCEGFLTEGAYGYVYETQVAGTVPLNRYYSSYFGKHFITPEYLANPDTYSYEGTLGYVVPGTAVDYPPIIHLTPNPIPAPRPNPIPFPHPQPQPHPQPFPQPQPQPAPRPQPQPQPFPQPQPRPQPQPAPQPAPRPQPQPQPAPRPQPQPNPQPQPQPAPRPQPQPNPQPQPQPAPRPQPNPQPQPQPAPRPQPQPQPNPGQGGGNPGQGGGNPGQGGNPGHGGGHPNSSDNSDL